MSSVSGKSDDDGKSGKPVVNVKDGFMLCSAMVSRLSGEITCAVCLDFFSDPRILGCSHTFCLNCLTPILDGRRVKCPTCRVVTLLAEGQELKHLRKNLLARVILEEIKSAQQTMSAMPPAPAAGPEAGACKQEEGEDARAAPRGITALVTEAAGSELSPTSIKSREALILRACGAFIRKGIEARRRRSSFGSSAAAAGAAEGAAAAPARAARRPSNTPTEEEEAPEVPAPMDEDGSEFDEEEEGRGGGGGRGERQGRWRRPRGGGGAGAARGGAAGGGDEARDGGEGGGGAAGARGRGAGRGGAAGAEVERVAGMLSGCLELVDGRELEEVVSPGGPASPYLRDLYEAAIRLRRPSPGPDDFTPLSAAPPRTPPPPRPRPRGPGRRPAARPRRHRPHLQARRPAPPATPARPALTGRSRSGRFERTGSTSRALVIAAGAGVAAPPAGSDSVSPPPRAAAPPRRPRGGHIAGVALPAPRAAAARLAPLPRRRHLLLAPQVGHPPAPPRPAPPRPAAPLTSRRMEEVGPFGGPGGAEFSCAHPALLMPLPASPPRGAGAGAGRASGSLFEHRIVRVQVWLAGDALRCIRALYSDGETSMAAGRVVEVGAAPPDQEALLEDGERLVRVRVHYGMVFSLRPSRGVGASTAVKGLKLYTSWGREIRLMKNGMFDSKAYIGVGEGQELAGFFGRCAERHVEALGFFLVERPGPPPSPSAPPRPPAPERHAPPPPPPPPSPFALFRMRFIACTLWP
eukprot:tig00000789_g4099.t1